MAQFVLVNVVVAVLMKKLDVCVKLVAQSLQYWMNVRFLQESNRMMADDAEIDEEIERQLEADAEDRNYLEQPLLDDKELEVRLHWSLADETVWNPKALLESKLQWYAKCEVI